MFVFVDVFLSHDSVNICCYNIVNFCYTEPEFSVEVSKSSGIVGPVTIEIFASVLSSLKHLQYYNASDIVKTLRDRLKINLIDKCK